MSDEATHDHDLKPVDPVGFIARTTHVRPDHFLIGLSKPGPSDCVWIVPGTTP